MSKIKPIFVIGMDRSGTKWLSNILCNHYDIIGIQYKKAYGILETNMFGIMQKKFRDISTLENYIGFIELWAQTNFFRISGIEKSFFYNLNYKPSILELFEILMNELAKRQNKKFWLQKTSPIKALRVLRHFNKGYNILIKRNIAENIKSQMQLTKFSTGKRPSILKNVFYYIFQEKILKRISRNYNVFRVNYEDLKNQPIYEIKNICKYLNIKFEKSMLNISFQRNSSFKSPYSRRTFFSKKEIQKIMIFSHLLKFFPLFLFEVLIEVKQFLMKKENISFIKGTFSMIQDEYQMFNTVFKSKRLSEI